VLKIAPIISVWFTEIWFSSLERLIMSESNGLPYDKWKRYVAKSLVSINLLKLAVRKVWPQCKIHRVKKCAIPAGGQEFDVVVG